MSTVALTVGLVLHGASHLGKARLSALAVMPAVLCMVVEQRLRDIFSPTVFKRCVLVMLASPSLEMTP